MKYDIKSVNAARQKISKAAVTVNTARPVNTAHPKTTINAAKTRSYFSNSAYSIVKRPIQSKTAFKNSFINQRVNTVRNKQVNTARPKAVLNAVKGNHVNDQDLKDEGVIDSECSRHMTGKRSYLTNYEKTDRGFIACGGNSKGGKVTKKVDYLSKWVEAKALPTNDARVVVKFLKSLFSRFERAVRENCASWSDNLDDALWAFRIAFKTPIGCTPYKLVYGKSCHLPTELEHRAYWALKHVNFNLRNAGDHRKLQLNEFSELCDQAYKNSMIYKERTKKLHDFKIKNRIFSIGDQVLLFSSRLKIFSRKLKTRLSGPFTITQVFPYGTIELSQPNGPNFKFWTTTKAKNINEEAQKHANVDGKNVIISEVSIRRDLGFRDKGGVDCFSNEVIF
nr:hypothetical protein [Tanacetum cinerariifolium]